MKTEIITIKSLLVATANQRVEVTMNECEWAPCRYSVYGTVGGVPFNCGTDDIGVAEFIYAGKIEEAKVEALAILTAI